MSIGFEHEFKGGDKVIVLTVIIESAELNPSRVPLFLDKQPIDTFGAVGHTQKDAIDSLIRRLMTYREQE